MDVRSPDYPWRKKPELGDLHGQLGEEGEVQEYRAFTSHHHRQGGSREGEEGYQFTLLPTAKVNEINDKVHNIQFCGRCPRHASSQGSFTSPVS
jgi:hypothetical protein